MARHQKDSERSVYSLTWNGDRIGLTYRAISHALSREWSLSESGAALGLEPFADATAERSAVSDGRRFPLRWPSIPRA